MKRKTRNFKYLLASVLLLSSLCIGLSFSAAIDNKQRPISQNTRLDLSKFIWYGRIPGNKSYVMLLTSKLADADEVSFAGYTLPESYPGNPTKVFELKECSFSIIENMKVYLDPKRHVIYSVISGGGASTAGVWVIQIDKLTVVKTLFLEMNRGEPRFQMRNGKPVIRELWEIARLMEHNWRPSKAFDGHVLVERLYRMADNGRFVLTTIRPALSDEKKLKRSDYRRLIDERHAVESDLMDK